MQRSQQDTNGTKCNTLVPKGSANMETFRRTFVTTCVASLLLQASAIAKAIPIEPVPPIISGGIRYSAEGDARNQYVVATDTSSGKWLLKVKIYHNHIKMWGE
jgi:hypothetical protein